MSCRLSASSGSTVSTSSQAPWSRTSCSVHVPRGGRLAGDPRELVVAELPDLDRVVGHGLLGLGHGRLLLVGRKNQAHRPDVAGRNPSGEHVMGLTADPGIPAARRGLPGMPRLNRITTTACTSVAATLVSLGVAAFAAPAHAATFVVDKPSDAGAGSLRQAILDANALAGTGPDRVRDPGRPGGRAGDRAGQRPAHASPGGSRSTATRRPARRRRCPACRPRCAS